MHADGLVRLLLNLGEGVNDNGEQEVEKHHEDQQLITPEEERAGDILKPGKGSEVIVDIDVSEEDLEAGVDRISESSKFLCARMNFILIHELL